MRNFSVIPGPRFYLENSCEFSNPMTTKISGAFEITLGGKFPAGTQISFICKQLCLEKEIVLKSDAEAYSDYIHAACVPESSRGIATLKVSLPKDSEGEKGAYASLTFYVLEKGRKLLYPHIQTLALNSHAMKPLDESENGQLVKVGQCTVSFEK